MLMEQQEPPQKGLPPPQRACFVHLAPEATLGFSPKAAGRREEGAKLEMDRGRGAARARTWTPAHEPGLMNPPRCLRGGPHLESCSAIH